MASWYGKENKKSATGKPLHKKQPALAHKTLPFGTWVKITSIRTKKQVIAVVEDRGPFTKGRIADLNFLAAKELGIIKVGGIKNRLGPKHGATAMRIDYTTLSLSEEKDYIGLTKNGEDANEISNLERKLENLS